MFFVSLSLSQKPTTGLLAITLALHFCDVVHIAGFGYPDSGNKKQTIHYYEQITLKSMAVSNYLYPPLLAAAELPSTRAGLLLLLRSCVAPSL